MHRGLKTRRLPASLAAAGVALLSGCAHPETYRWSSQAEPKFEGTPTAPQNSSFGSWSKPSVSVYSFATQPANTPDTTLRDLSDRGQEALIKAMTTAGADPAAIRDALLKTQKPKSETTEDTITVEGTYKRTLVANVTKGWDARPGDRLVWTWISVRPLNFSFDGYTVLATDNQLLNIAQITNVTAASTTASLGKSGSETNVTTTAGSPIARVLTDVAGSTSGLSGALSNTYTTNASINQQYVKLGADIVPNELRIFRESERNLDVSGNTLIALTLKLDPSKWRDGISMEPSLRVQKQDLAKADGTLGAPADVTFELAQNEAPPRCALQAEVILHYQIRRPRDGRSYVEGRQTATYERASTEKRVVDVVPADEVRRQVWRVYAKAAPDIALHASGPFENNLPIDFTTYEQARNFVFWLTSKGSEMLGQQQPAIGKTGLRLTSGINGQSLFEGDYFVKRVAPKDEDETAPQCAGMHTQLQHTITTPAKVAGQ
jgi:hypothetical protein